MKKLLILLALPLLFNSCLKDDEDKFPKSASERLEAAVNEAIAVLQGAENGWRMELYPENERIYGGYTLFLKFNPDNSVVASSEYFGANNTKTSYYSIVAESGPVLAFDTHNEIIHFYSSPTTGAELGIGTSNGGLEGDFDFVVMEATADHVKLKGRKTNNYAYLYPLEAGVSWKSEMQSYVDASDDMGLIYTRCVIDGTTYPIDPETMLNNFTSRVFRISYTPSEVGEDGSVASSELIKAPYICTKTGIKFYSPLTIAGKTITEMTFKENYYLENEDGSVRIYSPTPIHSNNKVTIGVSGITFSSATISLTPTVNSDYYYFAIYEKSAIANMNDKGLARSIMSELNTMEPDEVLSNYCVKGAGSYPFEDQFTPETEYVVVALGVAVSEGILLGTTDIFKKEFTTAEMPPLNDDYSAWLGTWTVNSTSSEKTDSQLSFDVKIGVKVPNKTYTITGWSIASLRNSYSGIGTLTSDGKMTFAGQQTIETLPDGRKFTWICRFVYSEGYNIITGVDTAMTLTLDAGNNTAKGIGYSATHPQLGEWQVTTMEYFLLAATGGSYWPYGPASGFTEGDYPIGPYTLTKKSSKYSVKAKAVAPVNKKCLTRQSVRVIQNTCMSSVLVGVQENAVTLH